MQSIATTDEIYVSLEPTAWRATLWVGAAAGHATKRDLLDGISLSADHRNSITRVYAAACADLAQATLGGLPSRSSTWERWFAGLRSTAGNLSPARGNPHVVQRALFHGARLEGERAPWARQLRRGFAALLAASLPEPVPALIGEDLATFSAVDAAWLAENPKSSDGAHMLSHSEQDAVLDTNSRVERESTSSRFAPTETVMRPIAQLHPNPLHPRASLDPKRIHELAASITAHACQGGVLQPLLVTPDGTVVAGHRFGSASRHSPTWTLASSAETDSGGGHWSRTRFTSAQRVANVRSVTAVAKSAGFLAMRSGWLAIAQGVTNPSCSASCWDWSSVATDPKPFFAP